MCEFMAAVVDVVAGCVDERAPRGCHVYALSVACCRSLEAIAEQSSNADEYSTADDYSKADSSSPLSTPSAPFANETDGEFDAFDVLMDAVDGCQLCAGDGRAGINLSRRRRRDSETLVSSAGAAPRVERVDARPERRVG